mmetsp:Transcript_30235/g.95395  ORF Transcript_30235/g.95395 Transcript_30235/m.95395 type:complete len:276 (+) Transcript_30235:901-1728(+)
MRPPSSRRSVRPGSAMRRRHCRSAHCSVTSARRNRTFLLSVLPASVISAMRAKASMAAAPASTTRRWASSSPGQGRQCSRFLPLMLRSRRDVGKVTAKRSSPEDMRSPTTPKAPLSCGVEARLTMRTTVPGGRLFAASASGCLTASLSCRANSRTSTSRWQRSAKKRKAPAWLCSGAWAASAKADSAAMLRAPGSSASVLMGMAPKRQRREILGSHSTSARAVGTSRAAAADAARMESLGRKDMMVATLSSARLSSCTLAPASILSASPPPPPAG